MTRHLIHVGFPKSGSTFLQRWFATHPQLAYTEGGIAGFTSVWDIARQAVTADEPRWRVTSAEALSMPHADAGRPLADMTHEYGPMRAPQRQVCELLGALFPQASVLIVTRGFASMVLSSYSQFVRTGGQLSFEGFCRMGVGAPAKEDGWDYDHVLDGYRRQFGAAATLVVPYELLREDAVRFVRVIEEWLDLDSRPVHAAPVNAAISPIEMAWYPRLTKAVRRVPLPPKVGRRVEARYLAAAADNRYAGAIAFLQRLRPLPPVTLEPLRDLKDMFAGRSESLRGNALFEPYADEYFL